MERLTEQASGCFEYRLKDHEAIPGEFGTYDAFFDYSVAVKKLGRYEDTGLEPEEINKAMEDCADTAAEAQFAIKHLAEIGVPPCRIGDNVFYIRKLSGGVKRAMPGVVSEMYYVGTEMALAIVVKQRGRGEWGKTVFPTLEAAEAALKKKGARP